MSLINRIDFRSLDFMNSLHRLRGLKNFDDSSIESSVSVILSEIKKFGNLSLVKYTEQFDHFSPVSVEALEITQQECKLALSSLPSEQRLALESAALRIKNYHENQISKTWSYFDDHGSLLGQKITPINSVGLYVPGGKAAYPSSVLMNAIPAKIAGVQNIFMVSPMPYGKKNKSVLAAAAICEIDRVFAIGGAQSIGALAYGTTFIPAVDKIVGPGNAYVSSAKRQVFGTVGIDMLAGPSEILIISDGSTNPDWIAMDLFSQAEHDEKAQSILLCPDLKFLDEVEKSIHRLIDSMSRSQIICKSLLDRGALILVENLEQACSIANDIAPEHIEIVTENPEKLVDLIHNAGAIFIGAFSSESLGDYCAGPSHVLPTSGTARFSSPLGVYDFQKRSSLIRISQHGASILGRTATELAFCEGLQAHALSAQYRMEGNL